MHSPITATGGGERISFSDCAWYNGSGPQLLCDYPAAHFFLTNCSLDYSKQLIVVNAGLAMCTDCYFENNLDTACWFVTGAGPVTINISNSMIVQTGAKPGFEIGSSASGPNGGINIRNYHLYSNANGGETRFDRGKRRGRRPPGETRGLSG